MGSFITSLIVGIFNVIGKALAGAFLAELSLVQDFINNTHVAFGGSFQNLLGFNAVVIPGLAILVTLVWLAAKGMTGGNSKTSTEDMLKRVLGALVISFALSLIVNPVESLIGSLDSSLMSLANVNSQGLQHTFAGIATISAIGGIEDSIFISILILFIGILIAGALILILILAHAAVFLLVYFAPYLTLFRKDGFREAVEGVVAALSMPFIVTSILAVGIATMGATGSTSSASLGAQTTQLTAMVGSHVVNLSATLMSSTKSISAVNYFTNAIGGLLILAAAVFLPKFILGMIFQAGTAMHDAFRSGHQQLASQAVNHASPSASGKEGKLSRLLHAKLGPKEDETTTSTTFGGSANRGSLADQAFSAGKSSSSGVQTVPTSTDTTDSTPRQNRTVGDNIPSATSDATTASSGTSNADVSTSPIYGPPSPYDTADNTPPTEEISATPVSADATSAIPLVETPNAANLATSSESAAPSTENGKKANDKPLPTRVAHFTKDHYKGTIRAIPDAISSMPRFSPENPVQTTLEARAAWRTAKRQNIRQVRDERAQDEKENPRDWSKKAPKSDSPPAVEPETSTPDLAPQQPPASDGDS